MFDGITPQLLFGQLLIGVINGSFYAMLAMGLAIIFGLMHVVNFAHGAQYMLGAFATLLGALAWLIAPQVPDADVFLVRQIFKPDVQRGFYHTDSFQ